MLRKGFTKFELALGLALLAIVAVVLFPPLRSGVEEDQAIRAWSRAESIAYAILDYHDETGRWPATAGSALDLSCLTEAVPGAAAPPAMALMGAHGLNGLPGVEEEPEPPVLEDVPLDAWDRPFTVLVLDIPGSDDRALIVLSAGADGVLETDPAIWPLACLTAPEPRSAVNPDTPQEKFTVGDDLACLMKLTADGGM